MIKIGTILSLLLLMSLTSCFNEKIFPDIPSIKFQNIKFIDTELTDSLVLTFDFEDGNADIGLDATINDRLDPYHVYNFIIDANDSIIFIGDDDIDLPLYIAPVLIDQEDGDIVYFYFPLSKELFSLTDNRPAYKCSAYQIIDSDTIYIHRNEFHRNFHIEFQGKVNGSYNKLNFREIFGDPDCTLGDFNGRIPYYDPEGKSGTFTYSMISQAFRLAFLDDTIRVKFYIYDRALNKSNEEFSSDFVLKNITQ